eukprot:TRINITY_DN46823_c0_g1_i1.p2 TRINITY_DN46823_c0_g1~~TRINITY_DN46823_c0_g1_i1.p2  ORF type:complete len:211 (+),score=47.11 TRINITY_DN46823_c0_g1_i1:84-635(+)
MRAHPDAMGGPDEHPPEEDDSRLGSVLDALTTLRHQGVLTADEYEGAERAALGGGRGAGVAPGGRGAGREPRRQGPHYDDYGAPRGQRAPAGVDRGMDRHAAAGRAAGGRGRGGGMEVHIADDGGAGGGFDAAVYDDEDEGAPAADPEADQWGAWYGGEEAQEHGGHDPAPAHGGGRGRGQRH